MELARKRPLSIEIGRCQHLHTRGRNTMHNISDVERILQHSALGSELQSSIAWFIATEDEIKGVSWARDEALWRVSRCFATLAKGAIQFVQGGPLSAKSSSCGTSFQQPQYLREQRDCNTDLVPKPNPQVTRLGSNSLCNTIAPVFRAFGSSINNCKPARICSDPMAFQSPTGKPIFSKFNPSTDCFNITESDLNLNDLEQVSGNLAGVGTTIVDSGGAFHDGKKPALQAIECTS
ncbi:hypothetical protein FQR65_LT20067 [Abscondita terminalis]|nr:hypothetical protein FQR65_LT20067 [Abscondita terminalis]